MIVLQFYFWEILRLLKTLNHISDQVDNTHRSVFVLATWKAAEVCTSLERMMYSRLYLMLGVTGSNDAET